MNFPGLLDFLSRISIEYRWNTRFICLNYRKAESEINKYRSKWSSKLLSMLNHFLTSQGGAPTHVNLYAANMTDDSIRAMAENASGEALFGYNASVLLLSHEAASILEELARETAKYNRNQGFGVRSETVNAVEALFGAMPGNMAAKFRRPLAHTLNLAHLSPFTAVWAGFDEHPCPFYPKHSPPLLNDKTDGSSPFRACLHSGDLERTLIVGPTGAGKSTLLGLIAAQQLRYPKAQVFAFDKCYSMLPLVWAAGGEHYDIAGDASDELAFCPLGRIDDPAKQDWAVERIGGLAQLQGVEMTARLAQAHL